MTSILRALVAWSTVVVFLAAGSTLTSQTHPMIVGPLFAWLMGVIIWASFGVVHEAEEIAERLGEPFGTLVLTLSIVIIEVALISAAMLNSKAAPTLGRDTMFSVLMIVLNGVVGLGLLAGGLRYQQQSYNLQGAGAYLALITPLSVISLVLPNFTTSSTHGTFSGGQAAFFSFFTLALYGLFLWLQTGRHKGFFVPAHGRAGEDVGLPLPRSARAPGRTWMRIVLLFIDILPILLLSKSLAALLDSAIALSGAPHALGGIIVAMIVFMPEGISALKAVAVNQLTRAINLCLGAATSTLGLSVPAVLLVGLLAKQPVVLGLSGVNMILLAVTLVLNTLTFTGTRTTMLEGATHLSLFLVFIVLVFIP